MIVGILAENSIFTVWQYKTNRRNGGTVDESVDYAIALRIRPKLMTAIGAKVGVKEINSDLATAIRTTVILFVTWGIVLFGSHMGEMKDIPRHSWLFLVLSGAATGLSWLFYFKALQTGDVSRVAPIDKLSVVITICLSFLFLKEPLSPKVILGAALITCGSIIMLLK